VRTEKDRFTVTPGGINGNGMVEILPEKASFIKHFKISQTRDSEQHVSFDFHKI